jgi:putative membrane protein
MLGRADPIALILGTARLDLSREAREVFRRPMRLLLLAPILLLLVLFALSNTAPVRLGLWPTGWSLEAPLSLAILGAMAVAFLIGGMLVWITELSQRRRARRAEQTVRLLETQVQALKSRLPQTALGPPAE